MIIAKLELNPFGCSWLGLRGSIWGLGQCVGSDNPLDQVH
jgi:hypothetical protein